MAAAVGSEGAAGVTVEERVAAAAAREAASTRLLLQLSRLVLRAGLRVVV